MEPMLEPAEERSFAALPTTVGPLVRRRAATGAAGRPRAPTTRTSSPWWAAGRRRVRR
jgi:hypothetical protein